jgi:hypothetical protein
LLPEGSRNFDFICIRAEVITKNFPAMSNTKIKFFFLNQDKIDISVVISIIFISLILKSFFLDKVQI